MKLFLYVIFFLFAINTVCVSAKETTNMDESSILSEPHRPMVRRAASKLNVGSIERSTKCCMNNYDCPDNAFRTPGRTCYDSISDCYCDYGYKMENKKCVPDSTDMCMNDYQCPDYSRRKADYSGCYDDINGCECDYGYKMYHNECMPVAKGSCLNNVECPDYSWRIEGQHCYNSFADDCYCEDGYKKHDGQCVPDNMC